MCQIPVPKHNESNANEGLMITWFIVLAVTGTAVIMFRQKRVESDRLEIPSNSVMLFHPTKGEGDLMIGGVIILYSFSRFILDLFQVVRQVF